MATPRRGSRAPEHPGHALQRILVAYERDAPSDGYPIDSPESPWAPLRHQPMAERAILEVATAPGAVIDRAALQLTEQVLRLHQDYDAYEGDDLATAALAGYAVGLDAVMRARNHRPTREYLRGQTSLLLSMGQPFDEIAATLAAASDDHLRGIADHLASGIDPETGQSTPGMLIDSVGGDASRLADLINAEITARNESLDTPMSTVVVRGRHTRPGELLRIGDAVRVPVPSTPVPSFVTFPMAPLTQLIKHRGAESAPAHLVGAITAIHPAPPERHSSTQPRTHRVGSQGETVSVQVAGHGTVTVPISRAEPTEGFTPVDLIDDHGQVIDPLQAEQLLADFNAWFELDLAQTPRYVHAFDHDRLAESLADFSGQPVRDLMARIQRQMDYTPLKRFCQQHPQLRQADSLFPPAPHVRPTISAGRRAGSARADGDTATSRPTNSSSLDFPDSDQKFVDRRPAPQSTSVPFGPQQRSQRAMPPPPSSRRQGR